MRDAAARTRIGGQPDAYARYLINGIRERFDLMGAAIRPHLRRTDNPFAERE